MANKFYAPDESRPRKVQDLFTRIAPRYDLINDLQSFGLHRLWKRRLVRLADAQSGERALDVCSGTGDVTLALARRGAEAVGVDFSEAMLAIARERLARLPSFHKLRNDGNNRPLTPTLSPKGERENQRSPAPKAPSQRVEFVFGDAENLSYPNESFEIVTISYGLRNLGDWRMGLAEMHRVSKAGGRLLVLEFGKPKNALWRAAYFAYLRLVVPLFGKIFCGDSQTYSYILESLQHFPAQTGIAAALQELGCAKVRTCNLLGGVMSINYAQKR